MQDETEVWDFLSDSDSDSSMNGSAEEDHTPRCDKLLADIPFILASSIRGL